MNENRALWDRVCMTDPQAVKPITGKQYKGNSPKPYWIVERLTEEFGPCGKGWGFTILNERMERLTAEDVLHVAVVRLWYMSEGQRCELEQIGQTKAVYLTSSGKALVDEDAPKKSVTDALVKCASYLGFAGDIFSGRWDDSKYVAEANREWRQREKEAGNEPEPRELAAANSEADVAQERRKELDELVLHLIDCHNSQRDVDAIRLYYDAKTWSKDPEISTLEHVYVWGELKGESKLRSTLKANHPERKAAA